MYVRHDPTCPFSKLATSVTSFLQFTFSNRILQLVYVIAVVQYNYEELTGEVPKFIKDSTVRVVPSHTHRKLNLLPRR